MNNPNIPQQAVTLIRSLAAENLSPREIASSTGINISTVKTVIDELNSPQSQTITVTSSSSPLSDTIAKKAADVTIQILDKIQSVADSEDDSAKLASLLRAVSALADSSKIQTSVTTTLARLR
ncbi:MAG: hypothetical protein IJS19_00355 [Muribaculaceae bacterium]|nr:hypothetical protein [Muribaculaceae bacterium]